MIPDGLRLFGCTVEHWWHHERLRTPHGPLARFGEPAPLTEVSDAEPLAARIYDGAWIVDCPCGGADYLWLDALLTICSSCGNRGLGGRWRRVTVPENRDAIERHLLAREEPWLRNWVPGETVADLIRENAEVLP